MNERMSLERIDEYMKQLKAVTDYDKVCEELEKIRKKFAERGQTLYFSESFAQSLTLRMDEMQQESEDKEERIRQCHAKLDNEHEYISLLEYSLKMARGESCAESLTLRMDEMQKENEDKEERIRQCHAKLDNEHEYISLLEYSLKMARQEISSLKKRQEVIGNQSHYTSKKSYRFNDFVSLGIIIDGPKTTLTRKMNAIYYLLLTNGLIRV